MDHMRISGIEHLSVILSQIDKVNDWNVMPKCQIKLKQKGNQPTNTITVLSILNKQHFDAPRTLRINCSRLRTWRHVPSRTSPTSNDTSHLDGIQTRLICEDEHTIWKSDWFNLHVTVWTMCAFLVLRPRLLFLSKKKTKYCKRLKWNEMW